MYVYSHNPNWRTDYIRESESIKSAYGPGLVLHHIGSTAIQGLYAKDCIDVLGVVLNLAEFNNKKMPLIELGYADRGTYGIPDRAYFSKQHRKVHLHVFETGNPNISRHLNFVDVMRNNQHLITELNELKNYLQFKFPTDKNSYQHEKSGFYRQLESQTQNKIQTHESH